MTQDFSLVPDEENAVLCPACGHRYDGASVEFCTCLASTPSPVCPECGKCLCQLPKKVQQAFWEKAPPVLFRRKMAQRSERTKASPARAGQVLKRPLVLVAEDEAVTLRVAQRVLEKMGYGVLVAERGDEAYSLACEHLPDIVLTDALMPKLDGRELCLRLKQSPATAFIKVVVMTGLFTKFQNKSEAILEFKADGFLKKPVDFNELRDVLASLVPPPPGASPA